MTKKKAKAKARTKTKNTIPPEKLALYDQLIASHPSIQRKGVTMPYTAVNGNMFTYLSPEGALAIRLPEEEREKFLAKYNTTLYVSQGTTLKEYVTVPDDLLKNTAELRPYLDLSYAYIKTLKPKGATKK